MDFPIKGFLETSFVDWPGKIASVLFLPHCNFRCPYCHNHDLVTDPGQFPTVPLDDILKTLRYYRGWIDGVCITGGEPTLLPALPELIMRIKQEQMLIKLDTNGSQPQVIKALLEEKLLDFIAMDVKGPLEKYAIIAGVPVAGEKIKESVNSILKAMIPHEFRTTIVQSQLTPKDILKIATLISGNSKYALQKFVPVKTLNKKFREEKNYPDGELEKIKKRLEKEMTSVIVR